MHGQVIPTVLDYLKTTSPEQETPSAILQTGFHDIGCVEAGGPKPGVGCAGRGIISAFEFLERHHIKEPYDIVVYDVLGDVVCGGFAVPVRRKYADIIFLVTSGEYMALYAANNILRGIQNFDGNTYHRVAGILYNERRIPDEDMRVKAFAQAVGLPVCAKIPRSDAFAQAESQYKTVMELSGFPDEKDIFRTLAIKVKEGLPLYLARPLTDQQLEHTILGANPQKTDILFQKTVPATIAAPHIQKELETVHIPTPDPLPESHTTLHERMPLYGCAFNGAATAAIHLTDALIIAHSPKSCAFYTWQNISSSGRKNLFNRGILMPSAISPNFSCTNMGQAEIVFGGMDRLKSCVTTALKRKPGAVIVISSCVSGIIGDDIKDIESLSEDDIPVIAMAADGDIAGDYMEGIRMCMDILAEKLIDPFIKPAGRYVNLVHETGVSNNRMLNYRIIRSLLEQMDIRINCRFLGDATVKDMKNFLAAPLNILADTGEDGQRIKRRLMEKYGCRFLDGGFPVGFQASARFVRQLGIYFQCKKAAEQIINKEKEVYDSRIHALKPILSGKRILMTTVNINMDWLIEAAHTIGMEFSWIGVLNYLHTELNITDHPENCPVIEECTDFSRIEEKIYLLKPDIILSNYTSSIEEGNYLTDSMPMTPVAGFHSALHIFEKWAKLINLHGKKGGWKDDKSLFEKYYA